MTDNNLAGAKPLTEAECAVIEMDPQTIGVDLQRRLLATVKALAARLEAASERCRDAEERAWNAGCTLRQVARECSAEHNHSEGAPTAYGDCPACALEAALREGAELEKLASYAVPGEARLEAAPAPEDAHAVKHDGSCEDWCQRCVRDRIQREAASAPIYARSDYSEGYNTGYAAGTLEQYGGETEAWELSLARSRSECQS